MDEESKALIEAAVHEAATPFTGVIADLIGVAGGDALHRFRQQRNERRPENQRDTLHAAGRALVARGVTPDRNTGPEKIVEILEAAQDQSDAALKELFGKLLAAAVDPARSHLFRRDFVDLVKQLEPVDALVLKTMANGPIWGPEWLGKTSVATKLPQVDVEVAGLNLERLGLLKKPVTARAIDESAVVSAVGKQFLTCIADYPPRRDGGVLLKTERAALLAHAILGRDQFE